MTSLFKKHKRTPKELALKLANALDHLKDSGLKKIRNRAASTSET